MNHTPEIKKALQFAARKHHGQMRKETEPLPYVTHLFSVAILVAEDGADDEVVCAALLHDSLEDTDTTEEEISSLFGERVLELVLSVTEKKEIEGKKLTWKERKADYLIRLEAASDGAVLIAAADKIDNIESKLEAFEKEGKSLLSRWGQPPESYLWYHGEVARIAGERMPTRRLVQRLLEVHARERGMLSGL